MEEFFTNSVQIFLFCKIKGLNQLLVSENTQPFPPISLLLPKTLGHPKGDDIDVTNDDEHITNE